MGKRIILSIVLIFELWVLLDVIIHPALFDPSREAFHDLWFSAKSMKTGYIYTAALFGSFVFTGIYTALITDKNMSVALAFGLLLGTLSGFGMGFGSYTVMPISIEIATFWAFGEILKYTLAGLVVGLLIQD